MHFNVIILAFLLLGSLFVEVSAQAANHTPFVKIGVLSHRGDEKKNAVQEIFEFVWNRIIDEPEHLYPAFKIATQQKQAA